MAGGFHYFFNHEAEHRPFRYPECVIDSCLTRAMRKTAHRFDEGMGMLEEYEAAYIENFYRVSNEEDYYFNDLHCLFGAVCCLAELQQALPGTLITEQPLRLVLDRRPFI